MNRHLTVFAAYLIGVIAGQPLAYATDHARGSSEVSAVPQAVRDYRHALDAIRAHAPGAPTVEALFAQGRRAADILIRPDASHANLIERLSEDAFNATAAAFDGFEMNRQEVEYATADAGFFLILARENGTEADRSFFETYRHTYSGSGWPAYVQQQTDYSGCTRYGDGTLTRLYGEWAAYRARYPTHYTDIATERMQEIVSELAAEGGGCACDDAESVRKELAGFVAAFPSTPAARAVRARLLEIERRQSRIRFHCHSG